MSRRCEELSWGQKLAGSFAGMVSSAGVGYLFFRSMFHEAIEVDSMDGDTRAALLSVGLLFSAGALMWSSRSAVNACKSRPAAQPEAAQQEAADIEAGNSVARVEKPRSGCCSGGIFRKLCCVGASTTDERLSLHAGCEENDRPVYSAMADRQ